MTAASGTPGTVLIDPAITEVSTASGLEALDQSQSSYLNNSNVCIIIAANINMSSNGVNYTWAPIGNLSNPFKGILNGGFHTINGYDIIISSNTGFQNVGFLGFNCGIVKNITVGGNIYMASSVTTGQIAFDIGGIAGLNDGQIINSNNVGNINLSASGVCVGGIVGRNSGEGELYNTSNSGQINALSWVGGIVGNNEGGTNEGYNMGSVSGESCVGGVIGYNTISAFGNINIGIVTGKSHVGGVVGEAGLASDLYYSYNTGEIIGETGGKDVGGVVGKVCQGANIIYSYNTGYINAINSTNVGGLAGYVLCSSYGSSYNGTVEYSYNIGSSNNANFGGIAGSSTGTLSNNYFLNTATYAIGTQTTSPGSNGTNIQLSSFSTTNPNVTFSNWTGSNGFNTWNSGTFTTYAPWYEGNVSVGSGTTEAPMLVGLLSSYDVYENSG